MSVLKRGMQKLIADSEELAANATARDKGRADSMFMTVSGDHSRADYPEYVYYMSSAFLGAGGMVSVYEGLMLGGADKLFDLDELPLCGIRHEAFFADSSYLPGIRSESEDPGRKTRNTCHS